MTEEERAAIFAAPEFVDFFEQSTKMIQRALSEGYDYTKDYRIGTDDTAYVRLS
jgi:dynein intermediate chain, cytosolic